MIDYWSPFCVLNLKEEKHTTKKKGRGQIVKGGFILFLDFKIKILFCCFQDFFFCYYYHFYVMLMISSSAARKDFLFVLLIIFYYFFCIFVC